MALGLAGGGFVGFALVKANSEKQALINMQVTAQLAQTELLQLQLLQSGQVDEVIKQLELFLDSRSAAMDYYDQYFPPSAELAVSQKILEQISAYREQDPRSAQ
jgi:hypothetical protein